MSFISNIVGGILGASGAKKAANAGVKGAQQAQALELQNQQKAQDFQSGVWSGTQAAEQPYQSLGGTSSNALANLLKKGFQAPTLAQAEATPGFQFNLEQGTRAIDENAAANGTLMSGNTGTALTKFGQGLAETTYQQDYQNALNTYMANYKSLLGGTDVGLSSTGQLAQAGQSAANNMGYIDLAGGQQQAQQINNAAAARATGYYNAAKGWGQVAGGVVSAIPSVLEGLQGGGNLQDVLSSVEGMG